MLLKIVTKDVDVTVGSSIIEIAELEKVTDVPLNETEVVGVTVVDVADFRFSCRQA